MRDDVKCLVVRQPWAWVLVAGAKNVENRSSTTDYRGQIVIQAGLPKTVVNQVTKMRESALPPMEFECGALIGVVDLIDVVPLDESLEYNPWA